MNHLSFIEKFKTASHFNALFQKSLELKLQHASNNLKKTKNRMICFGIMQISIIVMGGLMGLNVIGTSSHWVLLAFLFLIVVFIGMMYTVDSQGQNINAAIKAQNDQWLEELKSNAAMMQDLGDIAHTPDAQAQFRIIASNVMQDRSVELFSQINALVKMHGDTLIQQAHGAKIDGFLAERNVKLLGAPVEDETHTSKERWLEMV